MACLRPFVSRALGALACVALLTVTAPLAPVPYAGVARAADEDPVVARVNGVDIRQSDLAFAEEEIGGNMPTIPPEQKRDYLINYLVDVIVLSQAAEKQKLGDRPDVKRRLAFDHNRLLMESLLQDAGKSALSDEAERKVYDEAVKQVKNEEEVHARHILVPTEDEAKAILAQLKGGADFATLAKEKSKDPGAAEGGDLGYFTKEQMVPEFCRGGVQARQGSIVRSGEDPVRLAHHQGRGQADPADADLRTGQAADRELCRPPRASGDGGKPAQVGDRRAPRQAGGSRPVAQSGRACEEVSGFRLQAASKAVVIPAERSESRNR